MKRMLLTVVTALSLLTAGAFTGTAAAHGPGACGRGVYYGNYSTLYPPRAYPPYPLQFSYLPAPAIAYPPPYVPYYRTGGAISYSRPGVGFYFRW